MDNRWEQYFYNLTVAAKGQVRCLSRPIGAVIVKDGKYVVSMGYNGPPAGFPNPGTLEWYQVIFESLPFDEKRKLLNPYYDLENKCPRKVLGYQSGEAANICPCAHAERNAIDIAAKLGHSIEGTTMYLSCPTPCLNCAYSIVTAGIKEVVVINLLDYEKEGITGAMILEKSGISLREYQSGVVFEA